MAMLNRIVSNATITTFNLAALIEIQNWNVLELQISSNCHAKLSVTAGSSFSMVLLGKGAVFHPRAEHGKMQFMHLKTLMILVP